MESKCNYKDFYYLEHIYTNLALGKPCETTTPKNQCPLTDGVYTSDEYGKFKNLGWTVNHTTDGEVWWRIDLTQVSFVEKVCIFAHPNAYIFKN